MEVWHRLKGRVPLRWRFRLVHHPALDGGVSRALRFHAGELLLSCGWRAAQVALIGPPVALVLVFEVVFETATAFHHSNWRLPPGLDRALAGVGATPRMPGIPHPARQGETNSHWGGPVCGWSRG